ncbi:efflux RND transporter periplasmic adaptor subunit [Cohnella silvisoli]|uniref:Efflux RND transporter periplasmic adaptor subunit n=1 Tax=Cohnella silvisoli TaxID=2873699 RepID=A0ABV1L2Q7_9BACL|nr:efflux RND transporter periplasmic adaptor subunit [Cohnella silvisoli]MCD9025886.1 efflux RND transporter periplasmic adaptor subunit [Cohnella silvisoli]
MSRTIKQATALGLAIVLGTALAGCSLLPKEEDALKPPLVKPAQENYSTVKAEKGTIVKSINGSGTFESILTDVAQFTGQGGRIDKIPVKAGDKVKKGDVLVQLILDGLDIQVKEQQLALEKAKYAYRQARNGDEQVLRIAGLQMEIEQTKYDRLSKQLNSKQLVSNIDGEVVFAESLKEGDYVEAYQTLVTVADPSKLRVAIRVDNANDIREVEVGVAADITLNQDKVVGRVVQTPSSSPTTLNKDLAEKYAKTLFIEVPKLPKDTKIGSMADVKIITQQRDQVIKIPRSGLRSYLGRNFVRVLEDGKRLREIDVEPGLVGATEVEIIKGLDEGQTIVLQ